ncbi:MAG: nucleoside-diphosphate-sugar epimerase [Halioglobus sp.]|jgi:nucleoside-diphosphate-sugar epimerase
MYLYRQATPEPLVTQRSHVAVTGATGFIGQALCSHLIKEGFSVCALVRDIVRASSLIDTNVTLVAGSLDDTESLQVLLKNCDAVIHCAAAVRGQSQEDFNRTNVQGTARLLEAVQSQSKIPKFLMISSLAAREPELSWYAKSKYQAEQLLHTQPGTLDWTILRPPPVYGPGDKEMLPVFKAMVRGIAPVPGDTRARTSLVHVDDVVSAITALLGIAQLGRATYTLHDGKINGYDWTEMADEVANVWHCKVRLVRIPATLLNAFARINLTLSKVLGYAPMLTPAKLRELRHPDWVVNNTEITAATGWTPHISFKTGLEKLRDSVL